MNPSIKDIPIPTSVSKLPIGKNGYPVPWFVAMVDGEPEFRCADGRKLVKAIMQSLCWVCGEPLGNVSTYVIGPMCAVNRTSAEPPSHPECAEYSVKACPFLSRPGMVRRCGNLPDGSVDPAGEMIERNPGVTLLWYTNKPTEQFSDGRGGTLFRIPDAFKTQWWCEGRHATRSEVMQSIDTGLPLLMEIAESESAAAVAELTRRVSEVKKIVCTRTR